MDTEIKLGVRARHKASKLEGILSIQTVKLHGADQFGIQPAGDGITLPDMQLVDVGLLEFIDDGVSQTIGEPDYSGVTVQLGQKVKDRASGFEGIAIERATFLDGCIYFSVLPKVKKGSESELPATVFIPHQRLERIGAGLTEDRVVKEKATKPPPGGPSRSIKSIRLA